jgi:hypothetical protein
MLAHIPEYVEVFQCGDHGAWCQANSYGTSLLRE